MAASFWRDLMLCDQNHLANMGKVNSTLPTLILMASIHSH